MPLRPRSVARPLCAGLLLAAATVGSTFAQTPPPVAVEGSPGFDPYQYVGKGDAYNCANFRSQAEAQAVLRADPTEPNRLDQGGVPGVACEANKGAQDRIPVALP